MPFDLGGQYLLQSANAAGTAQVFGSATQNQHPGTAYARSWGYNKFYAIEVSGNSASASLLTFWDIENPRPILVTAFTGMGIGQTGTGMLTAHYPYLVARVDWVSAGTGGASVTGKVNLWVGGAVGAG